MNDLEYQQLSTDLRTLAVKIPLHWGGVQNNYVDDKINMFAINRYSELESAIAFLSQDKKDYLRRRWYLWQCSKCDEYLFYKHPNVEKNPNPYDKAWDVCINNHYAFDIKGTVIPKDMRSDINAVLSSPLPMIQFFYDRQSTGRRYDMQNRLFIVHHSMVDEKREFLLRCAWGTKENAYNTFIDNIGSIPLFKYKDCLAQVIFIIELANRQTQIYIPEFSHKIVL